MAQPKDFLLKEIIQPILPFRVTGQEVDKVYAVNHVEGIQLLGNRRLAFRAIVVVLAVPVLTSIGFNRCLLSKVFPCRGVKVAFLIDRIGLVT